MALVTNLYGAGLERMLDVLAEAGRLDQVALERSPPTSWSPGCCWCTGCIPTTSAPGWPRAGQRAALSRIARGRRRTAGVDAAGVVRLRLLGSCDSCPSSSVTLQLAVEGAIQSAAPEVVSIEVEAPTESAGGLISVDSLRVRLDVGDAAAAWLAMPELGELAPGEIGGFEREGLALVGCRLGSDLFAYRDHCPACAQTLAGARLERRLGDSAET